jgi:hypothetical protein
MHSYAFDSMSEKCQGEFIVIILGEKSCPVALSRGELLGTLICVTSVLKNAGNFILSAGRGERGGLHLCL